MSKDLLSVIEQQQKALAHAIEWLNICDRPRECMPLHAAIAAGKQALEQAQVEVVPERILVTDEMHRAAVKVLHRASGLDGLPQRMMDAMLATHPQSTEPAPSNRKL